MCLTLLQPTAVAKHFVALSTNGVRNIMILYLLEQNIGILYKYTGIWRGVFHDENDTPRGTRGVSFTSGRFLIHPDKFPCICYIIQLK